MSTTWSVRCRYQTHRSIELHGQSPDAGWIEKKTPVDSVGLQQMQSHSLESDRQKNSTVECDGKSSDRIRIMRTSESVTQWSATAHDGTPDADSGILIIDKCVSIWTLLLLPTHTLLPLSELDFSFYEGKKGTKKERMLEKKSEFCSIIPEKACILLLGICPLLRLEMFPPGLELTHTHVRLSAAFSRIEFLPLPSHCSFLTNSKWKKSKF